MMRDANGNPPTPEMIEQMLVSMLRNGQPLYFGFPCADCGEMMWLRATRDRVEAVKAGEQAPRAHGDASNDTRGGAR